MTDAPETTLATLLTPEANCDDVPKVRVAVAGVGNCASALVQGVHFYRQRPHESLGLIARSLGGLDPTDLEFVAAFDVSAEKVGRDLAEAIWAPPNNTLRIVEVPHLGVKVDRAPVLDGVGKYLRDVIRVADVPEVNVAATLRDAGADVLVNYLPVGSSAGTQHYADAAIRAGVAFVNAMPVFVASDSIWQEKFRGAGLPVAGDDVMSQLGATVLHKTLVKLCVDRGVHVDETYQLNIGGDADFLNMLEESRLVDKRESKTSAVRAMSPYPVPTRIGPSDYVDFLENDKVCYVWLKGRYFGGAPLTIEVKLHVVDAFNSAGIMIDAVRATKVALDRKVGGPLVSVSAYCFKHPPEQLPYNDAKHALIEFVRGERTN